MFFFFLHWSKTYLYLYKRSTVWYVFQTKNNLPPKKPTHLLCRWRKAQVTTQEVIIVETVAISLHRQIWAYESSCWMPRFHADVPSDNGLCSRNLAKAQRCTSNPPLFLSCWHLKHPAEKKSKWLVNKLLLHLLSGGKKKNVIGERRKEIFSSILGPAVAVVQGSADAEWDVEQELSSCPTVTSLMLFLVF